MDMVILMTEVAMGTRMTTATVMMSLQHSNGQNRYLANCIKLVLRKGHGSVTSLLMKIWQTDRLMGHRIGQQTDMRCHREVTCVRGH